MTLLLLGGFSMVALDLEPDGFGATGDEYGCIN